MKRASLLKLLQISDNTFPSGSFAFSNGLETLCKDTNIKSEYLLNDILFDQIVSRWFEFDRYFIEKAFKCHGAVLKLEELDNECHVQNTNDALAMASRRIGRSLITVHKKLETKSVGEFSKAISQRIINDEAGYEPVVKGMVGYGLNLSIEETETGALYGVVSSFLSAAVRMNLVGALQAQKLLADAVQNLSKLLEAPRPIIASTSALLGEIASSRHKNLEISLFSN